MSLRYQIPSLNETNLYRILVALRDALQGRSLAVGTVTLTAGATSTTVTAAFVSSLDTVSLMPTTANAAAALGTTYIGTVSNGSFVITHANNAQTDRTFRWHSAGG